MIDNGTNADESYVRLEYWSLDSYEILLDLSSKHLAVITAKSWNGYEKPT